MRWKSNGGDGEGEGLECLIKEFGLYSTRNKEPSEVLFLIVYSDIFHYHIVHPLKVFNQ